MQNGLRAIGIVLGVAVLAAAGYFLFSKPTPPLEAPPVVKASLPPQPVTIEPVVIEPPKREELDAIARTLLGLDQKNEPNVLRSQPRRREAGDASAVAFTPEPEAGLSDATFYSVVGSWRGMKTCLASSQSGSRGGNGALSVSFTIGQDGSVLSSRVSSASNDTAREIAPCVEEKAKKLKFPAFAGIDEVSKEAKFVF